MISAAIVHVWLPNAANTQSGVIEHILARLYKTGTYGHVSLELNFPINEESTKLIDTYLSNTRIPYWKSQCNTFYIVNWSFYPSSLLTIEEDQNRFYGKQNTEWAPKYKDYINPQCEKIEPKLSRFISNTPFLKNISKIPGFYKFLKLTGIENFPAPYERIFGIKTIEHTSFLKSKTSNLDQIKKDLEQKKTMNLTLDEKKDLNNKYYQLTIEYTKTKRECTTTGKSADFNFVIPVSLLGSDTSSFSLAKMIMKMEEIDSQSSNKFDLYGTNCSETVLQILSAGDPNPRSIFKMRGFFLKVANPHLVTQLCEQYYAPLKRTFTEIAPPVKKLKLEKSKTNNSNEEDFYQEIKEQCPIDALSRCHSKLNSNSMIIPYLPSNTISELHELLSDDMADFACQTYSENGEIELVDPKVILNQIRTESLERANSLKNNNNNSNNNINIIRNHNDGQNPKKRKRDPIDF